MENLPTSYGVKFDFEIKTDTRGFDLVDAAAQRAKIKHLPEKPTSSQAISRAINSLMRACAASIEFPAWSQFSTWTEERPVYRVVGGVTVQVRSKSVTMSGRNPNYSLKFTLVKQANTDASTTWRVNIADRNKAGENMAHVLSCTHNSAGLSFLKGTDAAAYQTFGQAIQEIITAEYERFLNNYNDEDIRKVLDAELADMKALRIIKKTNTFIPHLHVDRAKALYTFAQECGQVVSWLGLDNSPMTRDSLLAELKSAIFADMDEYEAELDDKLNTPTLARRRGEKQRERMFNTAIGNIDKIMALAEYHSTVLGAMAEGILERRDALLKKAHQLLTKDFDAAPVAQFPVVESNVVNNPEQAFG